MPARHPLRRVVPLLAGLLVVAGLVYAFWPKPLPVDFESVVEGPMEVTVDEEGKTRIRERYVVSATLAGRLRRIELDPGDPVVAGQTLLAVIEPSAPSLLDARTLAEVQARVKAAEAALQQAGPNLERARAALEFAQADHRRVRQLFESRNASEQQREQAELMVRTRSEEYKAAQFALQIAEFELEQARAALIRSQPEATAETPANGTSVAASASPPTDEDRQIVIHAPVNGRVLHVFQESAGVVAAGTALIEIGDPTDLEIEIDVLSSDAVAIQPGAAVRLEHWGGSAPLAGRVRLVEPAAFTKVSALGVEEQRVNVVVDFDEPPERRTALGDGYRVEARIVTWRGERVIRAPASALFRDQGEWTVFIVRNGRAKLTRVDVGHNNGLEAEILKGLSPGDVVIPHPTDKLRDGITVVKR